MRMHDIEIVFGIKIYRKLFKNKYGNQKYYKFSSFTFDFIS